MQLQMHMVTIDDLVPQGHFLRKLESVLDLTFVREETAHLYNRRLGRPPIDPVVLVKYLLVGYLYGIPSERQIEQRIETDVAMRWYLGMDLFERVPDHSTISQLRRRKPSFRKVFRRLFEAAVRQCIEKGLVSGKLVATDSTHVKASASPGSMYLADVEAGPGTYWEQLDAYEERALEELERKTGKRRRRRVKQVKKRTKYRQRRASQTDPEAGYLNRPGKPKGMHYLSHQTLDTEHGIILDVAVTAGDASDQTPYLEQMERVMGLIPVQVATADSMYDYGLFHQVLKERGVPFYVRPMKAQPQQKVEFGRNNFSYDRKRDTFLCPNGKQLTLNTVSRGSGTLHWVYTASKADYQACPLRERCLMSESVQHGVRRLVRSVFEDAAKANLSQSATPEYRQALRKRQIWCEGTFAIQKWNHNLRQVLRRGLEAAEDHCLLSAVALNLKRMIKWTS